MSTPLAHSPADILRRTLIATGQGNDPPTSPWPVYAAGEPNAPDNVVTVYDTLGRGDGRAMPTGERTEHHGVQVRVRAGTHKDGYAKARAVAVALDESIYDVAVTLDAQQYLVHSVTRTGDVLALGKESPTSRRSLFTINALVTIRAL